MKRRFLIIAATGVAALSLSPVVAQMKSKDAPSATEQTTTSKERAATDAAERWLELVDRKEYGKAWDQCASIFQAKVPRQQWLEGLPATRGPLGPVKKRTVKGTGYRQSLPGAPDGEYVTVGFDTVFEKRQDATETITLMLDGASWRPIGYAIQ